MARTVRKRDSSAFFSADWRVLARVTVVGLVFGLLLSLSPLVINYLLCRFWPAQCLADVLVTYRLGLILSLGLGSLILVLLKLERVGFISLPMLFLLWNFDLTLAFWPGRLGFYTLIGASMLLLFAWLSQVKNWRVVFGLDLFLVIILSLIMR